MTDDAIHLRDPDTPLRTLCAQRTTDLNVAEFDGRHPDAMAGCWTCLKVAEGRRYLNDESVQTALDRHNARPSGVPDEEFFGTAEDRAAAPAGCPDCILWEPGGTCLSCGRRRPEDIPPSSEGAAAVKLPPRVSTYAIDLCDSCATGVESGNYVGGCAFCDVGLHPHPHLYEMGWLRPVPALSEQGERPQR